MELRTLLHEILEEVRPLQQQGQVAQYIPPLALVPRSKLGLAVVTLDGEVHAVGDAEEPFSTQSISKVFTLTLAFQQLGEELWQRVGREPSGTAFNSLVQLESERGIPRNPFINAGAHVVDDIVLSRYAEPRTALLDFVRCRAANGAIADVAAVAEAERETGFRNAALANFLKSFGNLERTVDEVLAYYFFHCSLAMSCVDLARSFAFLAHRGICPWTRERLLTPSQTKRINALLLTCGTYDAAGDFAYEVGIPAKSGVGGGIVGIIPDRLAIAVWSPALNAKGNSLAGTAALERFTTRSGLSVF
ncbi:MAG: glutaminase [Planctomycetes bacterium]|nr:glutaminase [Planctomycetota bacterium]